MLTPKSLCHDTQTAAYDKDIGKPQAEEAQIHRIRITLTSTNVKALEKGKCSSEAGVFAGRFDGCYRRLKVF